MIFRERERERISAFCIKSAPSNISRSRPVGAQLLSLLQGNQGFYIINPFRVSHWVHKVLHFNITERRRGQIGIYKGSIDPIALPKNGSSSWQESSLGNLAIRFDGGAGKTGNYCLEKNESLSSDLWDVFSSYDWSLKRLITLRDD